MLKKRERFFKREAYSGCINYQNCWTFIYYFFIYSVDKYQMDIGNNKYFVYCNLTNSIKQGR
jgi:hypothetical protein